LFSQLNAKKITMCKRKEDEAKATEDDDEE
jgi:hypothetical protein